MKFKVIKTEQIHFVLSGVLGKVLCSILLSEVWVVSETVMQLRVSGGMTLTEKYHCGVE